jgi:cell division protein FtsQ
VARLPPAARRLDLLPSGRSIAIGIGIVTFALLALLVARDTSVFAVRTIEVRGPDAKLDHRVEAALEPLRGRSLFKVDGAEVNRLATALPAVAGVTYDRAFPNTLRVSVQPEEPVAVVRHRTSAWLVSRQGRVMAKIPQRTHVSLPRIWLAQPLAAPIGGTLGSGAGAEEVTLLDALSGASLARRIASVRKDKGQWLYVVRGGLEIRVGDATDLPLKLAIAAEILKQTPVTGYLDVSVPQRPVAHGNAQVSG